MRLENITGLVCLSFALLFLCVNSQSCKSGWFGPGCKYKCRCENNTCDVSGSCTAPFTCQGGWFGPACQYADLAYLRAPSPELTDGNDSTCITATSITIQLNNTHFFTWMRVIISDKAPAVVDNLTVTFSSNKTLFNCADLKTYVVDKRTVDLHCNLTEDIDELTLNAKAVSGLCSVYVSGAGRNMALKEKAYQDSNFGEKRSDVYRIFTADLAVDGGTNQNLYDLPETCAVTNHTLRWTLSLSMPRRVYRYVIYNRWDDTPSRLTGFRLQSFDSSNGSVFEYNDPTTVVDTRIYRIIHRPTSIEKIVITGVDFSKILQLCEVEVYGDSDCDYNRYGRDCELSCNCLPLEACFASTGGCPSGCPTGFYGDGCMIKCPVGKFGAYCNSSCSPNCMPPGVKDVSPCDPVTGNCSMGCKDGFSGSPCLEECPAGTFGANCNLSCSEKCMPSGVVGLSPCDPVNGSCRQGCRDGFSGSFCLEESVVVVSGTHIALIIVGPCLLIVAIVVIGYCFCKKRSESISEEGSASSSTSELLKTSPE